LPTTDSPAAARRRLRFALRAAREAAEMTQAEVAERLEWSVSKVNRIENGEVTISATDLRALMALLGVTDPETVERFTSWARTARSRGWWDAPEYRAHLTPAMRQLIQYEAEATAIRCFQPTIVPGALQTPEYARAVLDFWSELSEETRAARQAIRAERHRRLFGDRSAPPYHLVLDESVVLRRVGGAAVMAAQLRLLLDVIRTSNLYVRIIPLAAGAVVGQLGNFTVLDLSGDENAILYREVPPDDMIRDAHDVVQQYRQAFEHMWDVALTLEDSVTFIEANATMLARERD
jgi:transcriptional regulator with XRE-family HTH domain